MKIITTPSFERDYKKIKKRGYDLTLLKKVITLLSEGTPLPKKYREHTLKGNYKGYTECHILPDWLLIYKIEKEVMIISLARTGTHSDLF